MSTNTSFAITGITSGLGLALTRELLDRGHYVHGCGRRGNPLSGNEQTEYGARYTYKQLDIMDTGALTTWADRIAENGKEIDFLVHNAAIIHENAPLWEIDPDQLKSVVDVNVMGTFNVLRAFLPAMLKQERGIIITLSSGAGRAGLPEISGYCATKWAVEGLTKSLAAELPAGLAAIPMSPGIVDTDMLRSNFGERAGRYPDSTSWAKIAAPFILGLGTESSGESITVPDSH